MRRDAKRFSGIVCAEESFPLSLPPPLLARFSGGTPSEEDSIGRSVLSARCPGLVEGSIADLLSRCSCVGLAGRDVAIGEAGEGIDLYRF